MQISPIQQTQYQTANPSFLRLRGVKAVGQALPDNNVNVNHYQSTI